ncbi:MAG: hypothetical protein JWR38_555 [Mucilaginibacter sp.]|nr:hypothetical protein [Mucilaginibacter sp.]
MTLEFNVPEGCVFWEAFSKSTENTIKDRIIMLPIQIGNRFIRGIEINPHMQMAIIKDELKENWLQKGCTEKKVVMIAFQNVFKLKGDLLQSEATRNYLPLVRLTTVSSDYKILIPANIEMGSIIITVDAGYLKELLKLQDENSVFKKIISEDQPFLYEEVISPRIQDVAAELVETNIPKELCEFYLKVKTEELIYLLFSELLKQNDHPSRLINKADARKIYQVKDKILAAMDVPPNLSELAKFSGMSESKLQRLFKLIFDNSIYNYYQSYRMQAAASLIKEKVSISEAGYRLGFSNLSHFTRIFETHIGVKPKKYAIASR